MANVKAKPEIIRELTESDKNGLLSIYHHRCLNESLLYRYFYSKKDSDQSYARKRIQYMLENKLIESVDYSAEFPAIFLTTAGIETIKLIFDMPADMWNPDTEQIEPFMKTASELKIQIKNLRHQMSLNEFVLEFEEQATGQIPYKYYDEKFMPQCSETMMPDGFIELNDCNIFLELDMATERSSHLALKWNSYRSFLSAPSSYYSEKKLIVFFIIKDTTKAEQRRNTVLASLQKGLVDKIDPQFEIYVDTAHNLMNILFDEIVPLTNEYRSLIDELRRLLTTQYGFRFSSADFVNKLNSSMKYDFYMRKLNEKNCVLVENGRPQEYLLGLYLTRPLSVMHNILYHNYAMVALKSKVKRALPYLIIGASEKRIYNDLVVMNARGISNVFFTTPDRLKTKTFGEAIFQIDELGNLVHFNQSLTTPIHEQRMK